MLKFCDLSLSLGERMLVNHYSACWSKGQVWALIGANGVGKSCFLKVLAGLPSPAKTQGHCFLGDKEIDHQTIFELSKKRAWSEGLVDDIGYLSVFDCVALGRWPYASVFGQINLEDMALVENILLDWSLADIKHRDVRELSKGQQQRVALAQVAAQSVDCVFLDEPETHLDPHFRAMPWQKFSHPDKLLVIATHQLNLAIKFATNWCVFLPNGELKTGCWGKDIFANDLDIAFGGELPRVDLNGECLFL